MFVCILDIDDYHIINYIHVYTMFFQQESLFRSALGYDTDVMVDKLRYVAATVDCLQ